MARSIEEIIQSIDTEANKEAALSQLQSNPSRVSIWRYIKQIIAFVVHTLERMMDNHTARVTHLLDQQQIGSLEWYAEMAKKYQHGHRVSLINFRPNYAHQAPSSQIIKHAAIEVSAPGTVQVKIVKAGSNNQLEALSADDLIGFQDYINAVSFAGLRVVASSQAAIPIKVTMEVQINPQVITTSGQLIGSEKYPIKDALEAYFQSLPFNGWVRASAIEDTVQAVEGVVDVHINSLLYGPDRALSGFSRSFRPRSGHATLNSRSVFTYSTTVLSG